MPTFYQRQPSSIMGSVRALVKSSPNLSAEDMLALDRRGAQEDRNSALAEKARLEVEQMREAQRMRDDPEVQNEFASATSGMTQPAGRQLRGWMGGKSIPPVFERDDEGNEMPAAAFARPEEVTPSQEGAYRSSIGALILNQLATAKTNAEQLTQAGGNLQGQGIVSAVQDLISKGRIGDASAMSQGGKLGQAIKLHENIGSTGATFQPATGEVSSSALLDATIKSLVAQGAQRQAAAERPRPGTAGAPPKLQAGYRLNEDGELEPIPGGAADQRNIQALERKVTTFSTQIERTNVPQFEQALQNLENELAKYKDKADLPGVGLAGNLPQFLLSAEGQKLRQALAPIKNIELKNRSGAAVVDQEMRRYLEELGGRITSDKQLLTAVKNIRDRFDAQKQNIVAGAGDDVLDEYTARGGMNFKRGGPLNPRSLVDQIPGPADKPKGGDRRKAARSGETVSVTY